MWAALERAGLAPLAQGADELFSTLLVRPILACAAA
jgi:hypothetical protein